MTALGIDCSDRETETWFNQRPSHPVHLLCTCEYPDTDPDCPFHVYDPRTEEEQELDRLEEEVRETINSIRPGL